MKQPRKSMRQFIQEHRAELDAAINKARYRWDTRLPNNPPTYNDNERHMWILNDNALYNWARSEGVAI